MAETLEGSGPKDDVAGARARFDEACLALRPDLHRFCTRMTGSPCDGEDVLQDALIVAFHRLPELRDPGALRAWLFRIAHHRCLDFLRARRATSELDEDRPGEERPMDDELDHKRRAERALAHVVTSLPPRERAGVVLKDVLDCSLEEVAAITDSTVGAVKAAIHRGRRKLEDAERRPIAAPEPRDRALVARYLDAFNRRDWPAVQALLSDDARLEVVRRAEGPFRDACYFTRYAALPCRWRLALARVDGSPAIVQFRDVDGAWRPHAVVRLTIERDRVTKVRDYNHVDDLLRHCRVEPLEEEV